MSDARMIVEGEEPPTSDSRMVKVTITTPHGEISHRLVANRLTEGYRDRFEAWKADWIAHHGDSSSAEGSQGVDDLSERTAGPVGWVIRTATVADRDAILALVRDAFSQGEGDGQEEIDIVGEAWSRHASPDGLELVAVEDGSVLGHVLGALGDLAGRQAIGIAPLAVTPSRQSEGIGSALMIELLRRADEAGWPLVVLLGDPAYYERFGFEPAERFGIVYPPVGADSPYFQVRRLTQYDPSYRGDFTYCWEIDPGDDPKG